LKKRRCTLESPSSNSLQLVGHNTGITHHSITLIDDVRLKIIWKSMIVD
jgi:hypothetical protein